MSTDKTILISSQNNPHNHKKHGMRFRTKIVESFKETQIGFNFKKAGFFCEYIFLENFDVSCFKKGPQTGPLFETWNKTLILIETKKYGLKLKPKQGMKI